MKLTLFGIGVLVLAAGCKKRETVGGYVELHRGELNRYISDVDEAKSHLSEASRTVGCTPAMNLDEVESLDHATVIYSREVLERPAAAVPVWSASVEEQRKHYADPEYLALEDEASLSNVAANMTALDKVRYFAVAEAVPNEYSGWHGLVFLWDRKAHAWRGTAEAQWSSVRREYHDRRHDQLVVGNESEIGDSIRKALHWNAVSPRCIRPLPPKTAGAAPK